MIQGNNYNNLSVVLHSPQSFQLLCIHLELIVMIWFLTSVLGFQEAVKFTLVLSCGSVQSGGI